MVVAKLRDTITVSKLITQESDMQKFDYEESKRCGYKCRAKIIDLQREDLYDNGVARGACESIQHNVELSQQ